MDIFSRTINDTLTSYGYYKLPKAPAGYDWSYALSIECYVLRHEANRSFVCHISTLDLHDEPQAIIIKHINASILQFEYLGALLNRRRGET